MRVVMQIFKISAVISYRKEIGDHEGLGIQRDLGSKKSGNEIKAVGTSKVLHFTIKAENKVKAIEEVKQICDRENLYRKAVENLEFIDFSSYREVKWVTKDSKRA